MAAYTIATATAIASGANHTCVVVSRGAVECWGSNEFGELGDGKTIASKVPARVTGLSGVVGITAGENQYLGSFLTAPTEDATCVKFMAYGDTRSNPGDHDRVCSAMISTYTQDPNYQSLLLHVGDWVNSGDSESGWANEFFDRGQANALQVQTEVPINGCMGNHEQSGTLFGKYWPYPYVRDRYWSFDYGPAHIAIVDQYSDYGIGSDQLTWLENDLAASSRDWKFLVFHEPGWSAGGHANNLAVQSLIQPLGETYGVSIVFAGHNHYYARAEVNDVTHITTGGGGAPRYSPQPTEPNVVTALSTLQFCRVAICQDQLDFEAVDADGLVIDSFTILRGDFTPHDLVVDMGDYSVVAKHWLNNDCGTCGGADLTGDGQVELIDLLDFTELWLAVAQ